MMWTGLAKVRMQGEVQKWVDHSISVTINLPENATEDLVGQLYVTAWQSGCKGVTVYRDGSRSGVLLSEQGKGKRTPNENDGITVTNVPKYWKLKLSASTTMRKNGLPSLG